jgi:hypothetical protein
VNRIWLSFLAMLALTTPAVVARSPEIDFPQFVIDQTHVDWSDGDQDVAVVHVRITMKFTNTSQKPMILSRLLPPHLGLKIEDPLGRPVTPIDQYELARGELGTTPDAARFEIISPGATTSREFTVSFFVSKDPLKPVHAAPPQGTYAVSATLSTWPFWHDSKRAKHFQDTWQPSGVLVIKDIRINKLKVNVSRPAEN